MNNSLSYRGTELITAVKSFLFKPQVGFGRRRGNAQSPDFNSPKTKNKKYMSKVKKKWNLCGDFLNNKVKYFPGK